MQKYDFTKGYSNNNVFVNETMFFESKIGYIGFSKVTFRFLHWSHGQADRVNETGLFEKTKYIALDSIAKT